jgi:hypothetical protein
MMVHLDINTTLNHNLSHAGTQVLLLISRWHREIAFFIAWTVSQVIALPVAGVPDTFVRVDEIVTLMTILVKANAMEDEELQFRPPVAGVADATISKISFSFLGDVAWVARITTASHGVPYVTDDTEGRHVKCRVNDSRAGVRNQKHVTLVNLLETPDR